MKYFNKFIAGTCAIALMMSMASCAKKENTAETTSAENAEITIAVSSDATASDGSSETTEETEKELPETNEKGEKTIEGATFETIYGSQVGNYLNHQYYYDDIQIPIAESNFYFIHEFTDLSKQGYTYGYYPLTSEGFIDLSYEFTNGQLETFNFSTFGDFYREYSENQLLSTYIVVDLAKERGLELSDETLAEIDSYFDAITELATGYGLTLDEYLQIFYGPDMNTEVFRDILNRYYLSTLYSETYITEYVFDEDELYVPKVCHALFMAQTGSSEEELKIAKESAEAMLAECSSTDDIITIGNTLYASGSVAEVAEYDVSRNTFVAEFEDWAYDESRQEGDMGIVQTSYGYHVMGYLGKTEIDESTKTSIALQALNDEVGAIAFSDVHDFGTDDVIITPSPVTDDTTETTETETIVSLPIDDNGEIVSSETTTLSAEASDPADVVDAGSGSKTPGFIALGAGAVALVAAIGLIVASAVKGKKNDNDDKDDKKSEE